MWTMTARQALCTTVPCEVCDCSTHSHTHSHTSHTSHTHYNHTYAHPPSVLHTHTTMAQKAKYQGVAHICMPPHLGHTPGAAHVRQPLRCRAADIRAPPGDATFTPSTESWSHSSATPHQPCEPLPSTGCAVSTCPGFSPRSTREIQYSGNGPPQGPAPGSGAAVLSPAQGVHAR